VCIEITEMLLKIVHY